MSIENFYRNSCFMVVFALMCGVGVCQIQEAKLILREKVHFPLGATAGFHATYLQLWKEEGREYLAIGYRTRPRIYIYDYLTRVLIDSIEFDREGINGAGDDMGGFHFFSLKRFVLLLYPRQELAFYDRRPLRCTQRAALPSNQNMINALVIDPSPFAPILHFDNALLFAGDMIYHFKDRKIKPLARFNLSTSDLTYWGPILKIPEDRYYYALLSSSFDTCRTRSEIVVSFSISDSVYIVRNKQVKAYFAKSRYVKQIPYLPVRDSPKSYSKTELLELWTCNHYMGVKYDPFRRLIYRFVIRDWKPEEMPVNMPKWSIVVLNLDGTLISEIDLPEMINPHLCYINERGLHFPDRVDYKRDPRILTFNAYTIKMAGSE